MKTLLKQLKANTKRLRQINEQKETVKCMPYYSIFGLENQRQKDLNTIKEAKKDLLKERHVILENISLMASKELQMLSSVEREVLID